MLHNLRGSESPESSVLAGLPRPSLPCPDSGLPNLHRPAPLAYTEGESLVYILPYNFCAYGHLPALLFIKAFRWVAECTHGPSRLARPYARAGRGARTSPFDWGPTARAPHRQPIPRPRSILGSIFADLPANQSRGRTCQPIKACRCAESRPERPSACGREASWEAFRAVRRPTRLAHQGGCRRWDCAPRGHRQDCAPRGTQVGFRPPGCAGRTSAAKGRNSRVGTEREDKKERGPPAGHSPRRPAVRAFPSATSRRPCR